MSFLTNTSAKLYSPTSMLHVLLLEDDPFDRELIEETFKSSGMEGQFVCASERQEFAQLLQTSQPDIILADYVLPQFDGLSALKLAQTICPEVPFILVSGVLGEEQAIDGLHQGATDYVLKHRLERLVPAVRRALREKQVSQERQRVTQALKQTDDLLSAVVEASPVSIITLSTEQRVITWNATAERLYGWEAREIVDHPLPLIPKAEQPAFDRYLADALRNNVITNQPLQQRRKDGSLVDVVISLAPLHDDQDRVYGVVMTAIDNTLGKQIETQRMALLEQERAARAEAESASRIKDEFLAVLSHELRTPLNAIVGWIKLIQAGGLSHEILSKALDTIERNADAQTELIEDLLDISRVIRGQINLQLTPTEVNDILCTTADSLSPAAKAKSIRIELDLSPLSETILADSGRLQQIFWNLLSNAIKFTQPEGAVTVRTQRMENQLQVLISDSGIGIAPEFLSHVFEYFRQADGSITRSQGGLGLGLAITRHLVELHGGTIQAESPGLGQGSTFTIQFPVCEAAPNDEPESDLERPNLDLQEVKVLVVDDDADARTLVKFVLEQQGATVESAATVHDALVVLNQFPPDVLISDIGMPNADGYTLLKLVRTLPDKQLRNVPAIALTAYAREEDRQHALSAGFQAHLAKPLKPAEVVIAVQKAAQLKLSE